MKRNSLIIALHLFFISILNAQNYSGLVLDAQTNEPLLGVNVYFDGTTIGAITNENGEYSLNLNTKINAPLVFSYIGYEIKVFPSEKIETYLTVKLLIKPTSLDEVVISNDDWPREKKLSIFKREFLGRQTYSKDCIIENEDDITLRYNKRNNKLFAYSDRPIIIKNKYLGYRIKYNIVDFEVKFKTSLSGFRLVDSVFYSGTSVFEELTKNSKKIKRKYSKAREAIYKKSLLRFMRSLALNKLTKDGYKFFIEDPSGKSSLFFQTQPQKVFNVEKLNNSYVKVTLEQNKKIVVKTDSLEQSSLFLVEKHEGFMIDNFGVHSPIESILFSGPFGNRRVASLLPSNYKL